MLAPVGYPAKNRNPTGAPRMAHRGVEIKTYPCGIRADAASASVRCPQMLYIDTTFTSPATWPTSACESQCRHRTDSEIGTDLLGVDLVGVDQSCCSTSEVGTDQLYSVLLMAAM